MDYSSRMLCLRQGGIRIGEGLTGAERGSSWYSSVHPLGLMRLCLKLPQALLGQRQCSWGTVGSQLE